MGTEKKFGSGGRLRFFRPAVHNYVYLTRQGCKTSIRQKPMTFNYYHMADFF
jgi:hypothetical protein